MEQQIQIPTPDGNKIYGTLRGSLQNPLIIIVHGLGGFKDEHMHFNGSRYFEKKGYSAFRFNLYGYEKDARKLVDCTLKTHARDLDTVVDYFRKEGAGKIIVVGHSYGGPTILASKNKDFDVVVLWDPAVDIEGVAKKELKKLEGTDLYYADWGLAVIIGKKMVQEDVNIQPLELVKKLHVPLKIICAGAGFLVSQNKKLLEIANAPKSMTVIKDASHNFNEDGMEEKLFAETYSWIKKFV